MKYEELKNKYPEFYFHRFDVLEKEDSYLVTYDFEIKGLTSFKPTLEFNKKNIKKLDEVAKQIIFNIGLVELISYWKVTCSPKVIIEAGYLDADQIRWFKKLYYYGLGEFFFVNNITASFDDFIKIEVSHAKTNPLKTNYTGHGNLIPIGGGKDSCVTLEILKNEDNKAFIINPKPVMLEVASSLNYQDEDLITIKRTIDSNLITLNKEGYLNGHTPFSALVAFISYLMAYLSDRKYIVLSNEASANEATVIGTKINHQYSKTYEFENDFNAYTKKYFNLDIHYFSFLRPLSELQITMLFANYAKYHPIFKSCNVGSKTIPWKWCCKCAKCLFVYIMLRAFLAKDDVQKIFGEDLFANP